MRSALLATLVTMFSVVGLQADIVGVYKVKGFDPSVPGPYCGTLHIQKHDQDPENHHYETYALHWFFDNDSQDKGVAIRDHDHLSIGFADFPHPSRDTSGAQIYKIEDGGNKLKGPWTYSNGHFVGFEEALKEHHCE